jgi:hypothetical protein
MAMRILIVLSLTFAFTLSQAANEKAEVIAQLHEASQSIDEHSNRERITESLYNQIRPRANVTNKQLSEKQVDEKVREYVAEKYAPALVGNYSTIYGELQSQKKSFSSCEDIAPIKEKEDILKALCLRELEGSIKVQYMTNGYGKGWSETAGFVFTSIAGKLQLVAIELYLKEGATAYVEGI